MTLAALCAALEEAAARARVHELRVAAIRSRIATAVRRDAPSTEWRIHDLLSEVAAIASVAVDEYAALLVTCRKIAAGEQ